MLRYGLLVLVVASVLLVRSCVFSGQVHECGATFRFNFAEVYWNSRLQVRFLFTLVLVNLSVCLPVYLSVCLPAC